MKLDPSFGAEQRFRYPERLTALPTFAGAARGFTFGCRVEPSRLP